jgi:hypothetical protein
MCFTPLYGARNTGCPQISTQKCPQIRRKKEKSNSLFFTGFFFFSLTPATGLIMTKNKFYHEFMIAYNMYKEYKAK